jgi:flagellin
VAVRNTTIRATIAQNSLVKNERMMSNAMEQLSTGRRINSAADDAAGIGISSVMTSQIRGLNQAVRNANDALSMVQTAEGALGEVENMLQRMRELSIQASNDSYSDAQRGYAKTEFDALASQIKAVNDNTQFNGSQLFDGATKEYQIGNSATATTTFTFTELDSVAGASSEVFALAENTAGGAAAQQVVEIDTSSASASGDNAHRMTTTINGTEYTISVEIDATNDLTNLSVTDGVTTGTTFTPADSASSGTLTFSLDTTNDLILITAGDDGADTIVFQSQTTATFGADNSLYDSVSALDISTQPGAQSAISVLDAQIAATAANRASMGATINRLEYTVDNLLNESANTEAARSRVVDADYATATTELARTQIIQQAGTAMLAQANQLPQTVLSLLQ